MLFNIYIYTLRDRVIEIAKSTERRRKTSGKSLKRRSMKLKESQMLQSVMCRRRCSRSAKDGKTVEKWTFQLITPRSRLPLIALARAPITELRDESGVRGERSRGGGGRRVGEGTERAEVTSRDLSISRGTRELFKLQRALISLVFLSFPLSPCLPPPDTPTSFPAIFLLRVICSTTRCGRQ